MYLLQAVWIHQEHNNNNKYKLAGERGLMGELWAHTEMHK